MKKAPKETENIKASTEIYNQLCEQCNLTRAVVEKVTREISRNKSDGKREIQKTEDSWIIKFTGYNSEKYIKEFKSFIKNMGGSYIVDMGQKNSSKSEFPEYESENYICWCQLMETWLLSKTFIQVDSRKTNQHVFIKSKTI